MTEIVVIAAITENNGIGKDGDIPWHISRDFEHFKNLTAGSPCIMGDVTFESLPKKFRPLPGRENIVLTFDKSYHPDGTTIFHDFNEAIEYAKKSGLKKAFIIGGASIYKLGIEVADTLEITKIHKKYDADTFFPEIKPDSWKVAKQENLTAEDKKTNQHIDLSFLTYKRV